MRKNSNSCDKCISIFLTNHELKTHIKIVHEGIFSCEKCLKLFQNRINLRRHIETVHEYFQHFCKQCKYKPTNQNVNLKYHKKTNHSCIDTSLLTREKKRNCENLQNKRIRLNKSLADWKSRRRKLQKRWKVEEKSTEENSREEYRRELQGRVQKRNPGEYVILHSH